MSNSSSSGSAGQAQGLIGILMALAIFVAVGAVFVGGASPGSLILADARETAG